MSRRVTSEARDRIISISSVVRRTGTRTRTGNRGFAGGSRTVLHTGTGATTGGSATDRSRRDASPSAIHGRLKVGGRVFKCSGGRLRHGTTNRGIFPRIFKASVCKHSVLIHIVCNTQISVSINMFTTLLMLVVNTLCNTVSNCYNNGISTIVRHVMRLVCTIPRVLIMLLVTATLGPVLARCVGSPNNNPLGSFTGMLNPGLVSVFVTFNLLC